MCRDNELLDIYHLESHSCLKSLKHESKVLNATLHKGIIGKKKSLRNKWSHPLRGEGGLPKGDVTP